MMLSMHIQNLFYIDHLSFMMTTLVGFIGTVVWIFSKKYMKGDSQASYFFRNLLVLCVSVIIMSISDHLLLFLSAWSLSNWTLRKLIIHKFEWKAARASGNLAGKNFLLGFVFIALAFVILFLITGKSSIQAIVQEVDCSASIIPVLILLLLGAMTQSAIWPFHRWLISSLNSPTPVSAIMPTTVVSGGVFLLARFAPLYFNTPQFLLVIFVVGVATAFIGTLWSLMQHDVKRMLSCSTMGQMGFIFMLCGLGLFPIALAHLYFHGLFKAYLFLASGSTVQEKRFDLGYPQSFISFLLALVCGIIGSYCFAFMSNKPCCATDTFFVLVVMAFVAGSQFALSLLNGYSFKMVPVALIATGLVGMIYGASISFIDVVLFPLHFMQPQPLTILHITALILMVIAWLSILFVNQQRYLKNMPSWVLYLYVRMLNASQPHPATITTYRMGYRYV